MGQGFATKRSALAILMLVGSAASVMLACAGGPGGATTVVLKPSTVKVDDHIKPPIASIPGSNGGPAVTVVALSLAGDHAVASFVEGRLIVSTSSSSDLQAFLTRWGGTVLESVNRQEAGLGQTPNLYLVTINPNKASPDALPQDLQQINAKQRADLLVSTDRGGRTLAAAVREAATSHVMVGLDWLALPADEAPNGNGALGGAIPYDIHAANWPYMNRGSAQDIGVVAAWGLVGPSAAHVKVAILDGGYCSTPELPAGAQFFPATPTCQTNPWPDSDGSRDDFHGAQTAETAFGLANNGQGAAGVAGLVAQPVRVRSPQPDLFAIINYLLTTTPCRIVSLEVGPPWADLDARVLSLLAGVSPAYWTEMPHGNKPGRE
jgi:serine protease